MSCFYSSLTRVLALVCGFHLSLRSCVAVQVCGGVAGTCCPMHLPVGPLPPSHDTKIHTRMDAQTSHTWHRAKWSSTGCLPAKAAQPYLSAEAQ